jgi:hypothetical protein
VAVVVLALQTLADYASSEEKENATFKPFGMEIVNEGGRHRETPVSEWSYSIHKGK